MWQLFHLNVVSIQAYINTEEKKCCAMFHTFKLSLGRLNFVKNVNRSDYKISKEISPVTG